MDALHAVTRQAKTMVDGTLRISFDFEEAESKDAFALFGGVGTDVAIARMNIDTAQKLVSEKLYGEEAKHLRQSTFFRSPKAWEAIGTDADFLAWIRTKKCVAKSTDACHGDVVAAHVRRVANGSGTGIKPPYSAVPLCDHHHSMQHQYGESSVGGREYFDRQRIRHLEQLGWDELKGQLGFGSWSEVPPNVLREWSETHGVVKLLPDLYRDE